MVRCLKERKFAAISALKVLDFAISGNLENCKHLINVGGLKYLFPHLMGRNLPKAKRKKEKQAIIETVISIISQLCHMTIHSHEAAYINRYNIQFENFPFLAQHSSLTS